MFWGEAMSRFMDHLRSRRTAARRAQAIERALQIGPAGHRSEPDERPTRQTLP
jgi:hypothetical protein